MLGDVRILELKTLVLQSGTKRAKALERQRYLKRASAPIRADPWCRVRMTSEHSPDTAVSQGNTLRQGIAIVVAILFGFLLIVANQTGSSEMSGVGG